MDIPSQALALRKARRHLIEHGRCSSEHLDERLARSWQRSLAAGLQPLGRFDPAATLDTQGLSLLRARHHELLAHSLPVMEYLFEQVRHSQSVVVLADPQGTLMHTHGDTHFLGKAERIALTSGASWHEQERGTNAIGTAIAELSAVAIHGGEHYLERNGFLTCAAAPILSGTGQLLGILDISGEHRPGHPHTLGLVSTAARMIENRLLDAHSRHLLRLHLHHRPEGVGTVAEGIVAFSEDGWVLGANHSALQLLGIGRSALASTRLDDLLQPGLQRWLDAQRRAPDQMLVLQRPDGSTLYARLRCDAPPVPVGRAPQATPTRPVLADAATTDALSRLDTGDRRWRTAADRVRRVLGKGIPVLVQGESGVGKELFARAAHESGPRRSGPFVAINCAALPESLIESELFGHAPGAFTGAHRHGRTGLLRDAHRGTLFLDEIGDMPLALQTRLLRVLQERQVVPVGASAAVPVDFALICATHQNLRQAVEEGRFRADLYYRLNGLCVELPPLRERSDLAVLTQRLLAEIEPDRPMAVAPGLLDTFGRHHWPGNLRQYASLLRTACALMPDETTTLDWEHLTEDQREALLQPAWQAPAPVTGSRPPQSLQELSLSAIHRALENSRGNVSLAARQLGISRQTLYRKLGASESRP